MERFKWGGADKSREMRKSRGGQPKERVYDKDTWKPITLKNNFEHVIEHASRTHLI